MRHWRTLSLAALVAAVAPAADLWSAPVPADSDPPAAGAERSARARKDLPSPRKCIAEAYKNLAKAKGYRIVLNVEGGLSTKPDHEVTDFAIRETYAADVYGPLMHVPSMKTYRTSQKGVRFHEGYWQSIFADKEGKILQSFFTFPQDVLKKAYSHSRTAKWVDMKEQDAGESKGRDESDESAGDSGKRDEADDEDGFELDESFRRGKTDVAGRETEEDDVEHGPRVVRIEVPVKEALQHYITVENSGCLTGG